MQRISALFKGFGLQFNNRRRNQMGRKLNVQLVVIDPQNDFLGNDDGSPYSVKPSDGPSLIAQLPVKGAVGDMKRLAALVDRVGGKLGDIHVTLDSHRVVDIAHPAWWMDQNGNAPNPFTIISATDIEAGIWTTRDPSSRSRTLDYARTLEASPDHYKICVWPAHCLIGTWGHSVYWRLNEALQKWSTREYAMVNYVTKGSNPWTEHYGAVMAEVPDSSDPTTSLNTAFLEMLAKADIVAIAGEASSHCVLKTVQQIADNVGEEHIQKFHLLRDCMSPVGAVPNGPDFPAIAEEWLQGAKRRGMAVTTSVDFLA
ncbi:MAG: cysteine hydrolase [bacterium]|nr:cysteine hydrolase [bacterium]